MRRWFLRFRKFSSWFIDFIIIYLSIVGESHLNILRLLNVSQEAYVSPICITLYAGLIHKIFSMFPTNISPKIFCCISHEKQTYDVHASPIFHLKNDEGMQTSEFWVNLRIIGAPKYLDGRIILPGSKEITIQPCSKMEQWISIDFQRNDVIINVKKLVDSSDEKVDVSKYIQLKIIGESIGIGGTVTHQPQFVPNPNCGIIKRLIGYFIEFNVNKFSVRR